MTDDTDRDLLIARALERVPVPDYAPGFWDRLDARLADESAVGEETAVLDPIATKVGERPVELTPVTALSRGRRTPVDRRRSLIALAAAAAVIAVVVAVSVRSGRSDLRTAADISVGASSTVAPTAVRGHGAATSALVAPGTASGTVALGTSHGAAPIVGDGDTTTPQGAFLAWVTALHSGDAAAAVALTGPRTARYEDALGVTQAQQVTDWDSAWGDWATSKDLRIDVVELGSVSGARVVGVVLQRPAPGGPFDDQFDALPMVLGTDGWRVEPDAFDPNAEGRLELVSPPPGPSGLSDLPHDGVVKVTANGDGDYVLSVDLARGAHIAAEDAVDGTITWDPPDEALGQGDHLLMVAHVSDATITVAALPFSVTG